MPSAFSHALAGAALGLAFRPRGVAQTWLLGAACAVLPDADVLGTLLGVPHEGLFGHRGFTHSLLFAALLSGLLVAAASEGRSWAGSRSRLFCCFFLATASHGLLDAMTDGGLGVAFLAPFDGTRYFLPFRPIAVSPLGLRGAFPFGDPAVLWSEVRWVWLPSLAVLLLPELVRRLKRSRPGAGA